MPTEIAPISSLAFSVSANKGIYALLLGSGVSRSSNIPTGWEITQDLVRKVAALHSEDCEPDPSSWYVDKFKKQPDYSELLDTLCRSPAERQQLVRAYLEPTEEERAEGEKQPTAAHRAIASLVKAGFIRVILTTNFDKLTELALGEVGVVPTVLSSVDQIAGALPLVHTACTIIKIHGDYLDTRIRNTASELADYPDEFKHLLDRVFDEYGLIVCGWSADWDEALRSALTRAPYRRFSTYWASRGTPGRQAQDLIQQRSASVIQIQGADEFFAKLDELVTVLDTFSRPHPLSTAAAVASLKKYLSEPKYCIQLDDLVSDETNRIVSALEGNNFDMSGDVNETSLGNRVRSYESVSTTLIEMAAVGGYWSKPAQLKPWLRSVAKLSHRKYNSGMKTFVEFQRYPACLIMYAMALGAIAGDNLDVLSPLFAVKVAGEHRQTVAAVVAVQPVSMFERGTSATKLLPSKSNHHLPLNSWIEDYFAPLGKTLFQGEDEFKAGFDKLEFLWTLAYAHHAISTESVHFWVPFGSFIYRGDKFNELSNEVRESIAKLGDSSPYVTSAIFGTSPQECLELLQKIEPLAGEWRRQRW
jgi:hypothetical protein